MESGMYLSSERNLKPDGNSSTAVQSTPVFVLQYFDSGLFAPASRPASSAISLILTGLIPPSKNTAGCSPVWHLQGGWAYALLSPLTRMWTIATRQKGRQERALFHSFIPSHVTSYLLFRVCLGTPTFLRMQSLVPSVLEHCTNVLYMNWPFLCRLWQLGFFFFFLVRGGTISPPSRADSCFFSLPSSPTVQPCALPASAECQHSCIYVSFTFFIASPHSWLITQGTALFICGTFTHLLMFMFPSISTFLLRIDNFSCKHLATFPKTSSFITFF